MIQSNKKKRIVLFMPNRANPDEGVRVCADLLPLELLQIATYPAKEGYEVVLVDAMVHDDYEQRLIEACDGALLFASSCILGYQVAHGAQVARKIRARFPDLPIIWGGWFPSVAPELYLKEGIADAVALGQGEITFGEVVQAIDNGTPLEDVPGLVVPDADGRPLYTNHRAIVGFDQIPPVPWHLLDYERYVERQNNPGIMKIRHKMPDPHDWPAGTQYRGFSHFSSFGCPEPCSFCCSPIVTGRRWKAIGGKELAEELLELHDRFQFNLVRFQDANFGVSEKRSNEFCDGLMQNGDPPPFWWNSTYEIETIARYKIESVDKIADARCHLIYMGAEAGSQDQQTRIKKKIELDRDLVKALQRLFDRKITTGTTWIIGYPGETRESMHETIRMAAKIKHLFPGSASDIFPFRSIPGSEEYDESIKYGYQPPKTLEEWGGCLEYRYGFDDIGLPYDVLRTWKRYGATSSFYDGLVTEGAGFVRNTMKSLAGWRLKNGVYNLPIEHKLFDMYVRMTGQSRERRIEIDRTSGVTPNPAA